MNTLICQLIPGLSEMQHISYLQGPRPSSVYSEDFDSEELSLDVKNEDATLMFSRKVGVLNRRRIQNFKT